MKSLKEDIFGPENRPTPSCHASTVLPLPDGNVLSAWFGGTAEGKDDVDIWVCLRDSGVWGAPRRVSACASLPHWNPALFLRTDGTVTLYFKVGRDIPFWQTYVALSDDGGRSFGEPFPLVENDMSGGRGPVKNKPVRLSDGTVLAPASTEQDGEWRAFVDLSRDDGISFDRQPDVPASYIDAHGNESLIHCIQPTLWESASGVHMLLRTSAGAAYRSDSTDGGRTWSHVERTSLPNNNSGLDVTRTPDGVLWLVSNPVGENWGARSPLTLQRSDDDGASWSEALVLEPYGGEDAEFSYPAIVADGGVLHITYTNQRQSISYRRVEV